MPNNSIKIILPLLSFGILIINCFSIILQAISVKKGFEKKGAFCAMLASLNILDLSYSMPYFIMWSVDSYYGGTFVIKRNEWTSGTLCFTNSALIINYKLASPVILSFMTFSRLMVVKHPFNTKFKSFKHVFRCILYIYTLRAFSAVCISMGQWKHVGNVPFKLCSPFIDPTDSITIIKILIGVTVLIQLSSIIFIIITYFRLLRSLIKSQKEIQGETSKAASNKSLIVQIVLIIGSTILCWIPSGTVYIVTLFLDPYPIKILVWVTVTMEPINTIVHPIIFAVTIGRKIAK